MGGYMNSNWRRRIIALVIVLVGCLLSACAKYVLTEAVSYQWSSTTATWPKEYVQSDDKITMKECEESDVPCQVVACEESKEKFIVELGESEEAGETIKRYAFAPGNHKEWGVLIGNPAEMIHDSGAKTITRTIEYRDEESCDTVIDGNEFTNLKICSIYQNNVINLMINKSEPDPVVVGDSQEVSRLSIEIPTITIELDDESTKVKFVIAVDAEGEPVLVNHAWVVESQELPADHDHDYLFVVEYIQVDEEGKDDCWRALTERPGVYPDPITLVDEHALADYEHGENCDVGRSEIRYTKGLEPDPPEPLRFEATRYFNYASSEYEWPVDLEVDSGDSNDSETQAPTEQGTETVIRAFEQDMQCDPYEGDSRLKACTLEQVQIKYSYKPREITLPEQEEPKFVRNGYFITELPNGWPILLDPEIEDEEPLPIYKETEYIPIQLVHSVEYIENIDDCLPAGYSGFRECDMSVRTYTHTIKGQEICTVEYLEPVGEPTYIHLPNEDGTLEVIPGMAVHLEWKDISPVECLEDATVINGEDSIKCELEFTAEITRSYIGYLPFSRVNIR